MGTEWCHLLLPVSHTECQNQRSAPHSNVTDASSTSNQADPHRKGWVDRQTEGPESTCSAPLPSCQDLTSPEAGAAQQSSVRHLQGSNSTLLKSDFHTGKRMSCGDSLPPCQEETLSQPGLAELLPQLHVCKPCSGDQMQQLSHTTTAFKDH